MMHWEEVLMKDRAELQVSVPCMKAANPCPYPTSWQNSVDERYYFQRPKESYKLTSSYIHSFILYNSSKLDHTLKVNALK
jgi:hypothetical protein